MAHVGFPDVQSRSSAGCGASLRCLTGSCAAAASVRWPGFRRARINYSARYIRLQPACFLSNRTRPVRGDRANGVKLPRRRAHSGVAVRPVGPRQSVGRRCVATKQVLEEMGISRSRPRRPGLRRMNCGAVASKLMIARAARSAPCNLASHIRGVERPDRFVGTSDYAFGVGGPHQCLDVEFSGLTN